MSAQDAATQFSGSFDGVVSFNSIHLLGPSDKALAGLASLVKTGGFVAFCTTYHTQAITNEQGFRAAEFVDRISQIGKAQYGSTPVPAGLSQGLAHHLIDVHQLETLLDNSALRPLRYYQKQVTIPASSLVTFMTLPGMVDSLLPPGLSQEAIEQIAEQACKELRITDLTRSWLFVVAECR